MVMISISKRAEYLTALIAILAPVITGTLWIGNVASTATAAEQIAVELKVDLKAVPADVAVLKTQVADLKQTISDMRSEQKEQAAALLSAVKAAAKPAR
jgi:cell division protein FtsB